MGVGLFIFGSSCAAFLVSCIFHAFLSRGRLRVVVVVALLPCTVLFSIGPAQWSLYAIVFGASAVGAAIGVAAAAGLRAIQARLGW